jgi:hypothetical protein
VFGSLNTLANLFHEHFQTLDTEFGAYYLEHSGTDLEISDDEDSATSDMDVSDTAAVL